MPPSVVFRMVEWGTQSAPSRTSACIPLPRILTVCTCRKGLQRFHIFSRETVSTSTRHRVQSYGMDILIVMWGDSEVAYT